jgi:hypothetical protein
MTNRNFLIILSLIVSMGVYTSHSITKAVYQKKLEQRDSLFNAESIRMYDVLTKQMK